MPDNVGEMFYYGDRPWHKKGNRLPEPATAEVAFKAGGLDWDVRLVPIRTFEQEPREISRRMAVVRDGFKPGDPRAVLDVVHPGFRPLQNFEAVAVFDALLGHGKGVYHTGGYLGNGEVIWLLAKLPENILITDKDVVEPYMLLTNSHDGTFAISFRLTAIRVVCQNTLALAMRDDKSSQIFKRAHKVGPETLATEAKKFYQVCTKAAADVGVTFQKMHSVKFNRSQFAILVEKLLPLPPPPPSGASLPIRVRKQYESRLEKVMEARMGIETVFAEGCSNSFEIPPAEETLWGGLNAVTAFVDHIQKIDGDRYAHMLFGSGATLKQKAYELALARLPKN